MIFVIVAGSVFFDPSVLNVTGEAPDKMRIRLKVEPIISVPLLRKYKVSYRYLDLSKYIDLVSSL